MGHDAKHIGGRGDTIEDAFPVLWLEALVGSYGLTQLNEGDAGNSVNLFARSPKYYRYSNRKSTKRNSYQVCDIAMHYKKW